MKKRILSGMQPSGSPHLGNYLGAMRQHIEMQDKGDCYFFLANYHALTTLRDGAVLRAKTRDLATDYLALGLDPNKVALFRQSDVPEVTELTWILDTVTPMGLLERAHAWK
ncbi:MAG: tryptophan--tRNA ligase, partial [Patescibacteria group bacterium]